jgi:hypothetical protein
MLTHYGGYPAFDVMYDTGGNLVDPGAQRDAVAYFGTGAGATIADLIVISHGWNNDIADARRLYQKFFDAFASVAATVSGGLRTFGIVALYWPSKRFADSSLIPGGAAGLSGPAAAALSGQLDQFAELFSGDPETPDKIARLRSLVPLLELNTAAQDEYVSTLVSLVPNSGLEIDEGLDQARAALDTTPGHVVLSRLATPAPAPASVPVPGSGGAAGLGNILGGIASAAANLGDLLTYYTMKDRAGVIGRTGGVATIRALRASRPAGTAPKIHLVGHSFGARLVTAAANALNGNSAGSPAEAVDSLTLLEAAFSHNGFASNWDGGGSDGAFRSVIAASKVAGPIIISHSSHDVPVGVAYPLASRIMNQAASALVGGPDDKFGGMGRNGAQHTPEVRGDVALAAAGDAGAYPAAPALRTWVLNVRGDGPPPAPTIGSHGDVAKPELAFAMLNYI